MSNNSKKKISVKRKGLIMCGILCWAVLYIVSSLFIKVFYESIATVDGGWVDGSQKVLYFYSWIQGILLVNFLSSATKARCFATVQEEKPKAFQKRPQAQKPAPQQQEEVEEEESHEVESTHSRVGFNHVAIPPEQGKTFDDIAGYKTTKANMQFIVECLKNSEMLEEAGGKVPNGVVFYGPPGTGKTLMASAIAGTAGVNFITINASAFINTYVGTGAAAVRELFRDAKAQAPCIVFIDELDAIGGKRSGDQNQEYRNTINALLSELDGMDSSDEVLTIAATNTVEMLDDALVRPGRFDRKVMIPLPDKTDRFEILKVHTRKKKLGEDVNLQELARNTEGFSGATLATLMNEATLLCVSQGRVIINKHDIEKAMFQMLTSGEETDAQNGDLGTLVAWHEAGHALCTKVLCQTAVPQVTIRGSTSGALGVTINGTSNGPMTKRLMKQRIKAVYAGRVAEAIFLGSEEDVTAGASQDVNDASSMIKEYIKLFGIGEKTTLLNQEVLWGSGSQSGETVEAVNKFAQDLYEETVAFLGKNRTTLEAIANALVERKSLDNDDLTKIIQKYKPMS